MMRTMLARASFQLGPSSAIVHGVKFFQAAAVLSFETILLLSGVTIAAIAVVAFTAAVS